MHRQEPEDLSHDIHPGDFATNELVSTFTYELFGRLVEIFSNFLEQIGGRKNGNYGLTLLVALNGEESIIFLIIPG